MTDNMRFWSQLEHTDPAQTSPITGKPGLTGKTAIKPMASIKRMTDVFGPIGIGWGTDKPEFRTECVKDEVIVFCTVGAWFQDSDGIHSQLIYGIGGEVVARRGKDGAIRLDDEAYKKAYTDALTNALKHLGVAADVHMGLFEDSKYVKAMREEFAEKKQETSDLDRFANQVSVTELLDRARDHADRGKVAFMDLWKRLNEQEREVLRPHMDDLKTRCENADNQALVGE